MAEEVVVAVMGAGASAVFGYWLTKNPRTTTLVFVVGFLVILLLSLQAKRGGPERQPEPPGRATHIQRTIEARQGQMLVVSDDPRVEMHFIGANNPHPDTAYIKLSVPGQLEYFNLTRNRPEDVLGLGTITLNWVVFDRDRGFRHRASFDIDLRIP